MANQTPKTIEITENLLQDVLNYLASKPYIETNQLISRIQMEASQFVVNKKAEDKVTDTKKEEAKKEEPKKEEAKV